MQEKNLPFEPYFYIIQHTKTDKLYAGCRFSKRPTNYSKNGCNQKEFLKTDGYITSLKTGEQKVRLKTKK